MTAPITGTTSASTGAGVSNSAANMAAIMDKNAFMKLLVAQMTHQDPLNPGDGAQMATQLAQFSSVEQLMNISNTLAGQTTTNNNLVTAINNSAAVGLLGKTVTAVSDQIAVGADGTSKVTAAVPAGGGHLVLRVTDASGTTVRTEDLGSVTGGQHDYDITSLTSGLAAGTYRVAFDLTGVSGQVTHPSSLVTAKIDGVRFDSTGAVVTSGARSFPIGSIFSIVSNS
jgi:flagellar basal-body rod modification protein FlgD